MRRTRHVVLPVRSWQYTGFLLVSLACLTLGLVSRDREGRAGSLASPELSHRAPHGLDACPNLKSYGEIFGRLDATTDDQKSSSAPIEDVETSKSSGSSLNLQANEITEGKNAISVDSLDDQQHALTRRLSRGIDDTRFSRSRARSDERRTRQDVLNQSPRRVEDSSERRARDRSLARSERRILTRTNDNLRDLRDLRRTRGSSLEQRRLVAIRADKLREAPLRSTTRSENRRDRSLREATLRSSTRSEDRRDRNLRETTLRSSTRNENRRDRNLRERTLRSSIRNEDRRDRDLRETPLRISTRNEERRDLRRRVSQSSKSDARAREIQMTTEPREARNTRRETRARSHERRDLHERMELHSRRSAQLVRRFDEMESTRRDVRAAATRLDATRNFEERSAKARTIRRVRSPERTTDLAATRKETILSRRRIIEHKENGAFRASMLRGVRTDAVSPARTNTPTRASSSPRSNLASPEAERTISRERRYLENREEETRHQRSQRILSRDRRHTREARSVQVVARGRDDRETYQRRHRERSAIERTDTMRARRVREDSREEREASRNESGDRTRLNRVERSPSVDRQRVQARASRRSVEDRQRQATRTQRSLDRFNEAFARVQSRRSEKQKSFTSRSQTLVSIARALVVSDERRRVADSQRTGLSVVRESVSAPALSFDEERRIQIISPRSLDSRAYRRIAANHEKRSLDSSLEHVKLKATTKYYDFVQEIMSQAFIVALLAIYGASMFNVKGNLIENARRYANRLTIW